MALQLYDISSFQGPNTPDFLAAKKAGFVGVIIKFTEAGGYLNPYAKLWALAAETAGLIVMPYHFCHVSVPVADQVAQLKIYLQDYGCMFLDEEVTNGQSYSLVAKLFEELDTAVNNLARGHVARYTYPAFLEALNSNNDKSPLPLWFADPSKISSNVPRIMTQTGTGPVPGISGDVDLDTWEGDLLSLHKFIGVIMTVPASSIPNSNAKPVAILSSITGEGYAIFASDGGVFTFGDFQFHGSAGEIKLAAPIVSAAITPDGKGYWLLGEDGGVFAYGSAKYINRVQYTGAL